LAPKVADGTQQFQCESQQPLSGQTTKQMRRGLAIGTRPAEKYNFVLLGFGGLKSTKSTKKYKKFPSAIMALFKQQQPPQMINNTMQHISNAITTSPGVKQSFVISIGTFHEASAIIPVLWD
jgi:hypothetical protein